MSSDHQQRHLEIVNQFAVDLLALNSESAVVWHVAQNVVAALGFNDVVIYLWNHDENCLIQKAAYGGKSVDKQTILNPIKLELGQGVVGQVAQTLQPLLVTDTSAFPGYVVDDASRASELAVPMIAEGKLIGVIDSENENRNFYQDQHLKTLMAIASIAAIKLQSVKMVGQLQHTVAQLEYSSKIQDALFEIAELIFRTDSLTQFYQQLHQCIGKLTFAKNFYVGIELEGGGGITIPYCKDEQFPYPENHVLKFSDEVKTVTEYLLHHQKPLLLDQQGFAAMVKDKGLRVKGDFPKSWLGVPFGDDKFRGLVIVQSYQDPNAFTEQDKQLLSFVAKHIHNAIERMQAKADLQFLALHDPLTKLPNRLLFADRVEQAIKLNRRNQQAVAVLFLDLDKFKQINDLYGHHVGDELLIIVADRIKNCLRASDTLCRLGGDEFAVLLDSLDKIEDVEVIANNIVEAIRVPTTIDDIQMSVSTSIGVSYREDVDSDADARLVEADKAMYRAKISGRNQVKFYEDDGERERATGYKIESEFIEALANNEFTLVFQPIIDFDSDTICGAEALVRWEHPVQGVIPPAGFIDDLEKSGRIALLDLHVIEKALQQLQQWQDQLPETFRLSVNLSSAGFTSQKVMEHLQFVFEKVPDLLKHLCIEITEKSIVDHVDQAKQNMTNLGKMGIQFALDDFGTGYSSLSYLHMFEFDRLKIDRSFISSHDVAHQESPILESIVNLAQTLGIKTTAEGIETPEQYEKLKNMRCFSAQGFHMSTPVKAQEFFETLTKNKAFFWH